MPAIVGIHISGDIPGAVKDHGSTSIPFGFLLCDGSPVSRITYARLFSYIGTNYGNGDGITTFNLPDLRGQFSRGVDHGAGNDPDVGSRTAPTGGNTGDAVGSYQPHSFQQHNHEFVQWSQSGQFNGGGPAIGSGQFTQLTTGAINGNPGSESRPLNVYVNKIIAYI
jgi:phage-related tail fiber protein